MINIFAIADLHLKTISDENLYKLHTYWPNSGDIVVIVGDTEKPEVLQSKYPFDSTYNIIFPGNWDSNKNQDVKIHKLGDVAVVGGMGFNWRETPWAHHHLHDIHCEPEPFNTNLHNALSQLRNYDAVIVAVHFPMVCFDENEDPIAEPGFRCVIETFPNVKLLLTGHVHGDPQLHVPDYITLTSGKVIPMLNVAAENLSYKPVFVWQDLKTARK